ncbi:MAG: cyclic nucleotide-binding domain-containing protein [Ilumatobacter sp.]
MANATKQLAKQLGSVPIFSKLTAKHRTMIAELGKTVQWADGKVGVKEGSNASAFFYIVDGTVTVSRNGKKVATLKGGDFFGELALLTGGKRTATVTASSDTELFAIGRSAITPVIRTNPDFAIDLISAVARRFADESK